MATSAESSSPAAAGGFLPPTPASLPYSPAPSASSSRTSTAQLPTPRSTPLRVGGGKEAVFLRAVDVRTLNISRRFAKRFVLADGRGEGGGRIGATAAAAGQVTGYQKFSELARDLEEVVSLVWVSGTPSLQVQHLLALFEALAEYIPAFPAQLRSLFRVLDLFDDAFFSLIEDGKVSGTEKVRLRSLVGRVRAAVIEVVGKMDGTEEQEDENADDENDDNDFDVDGDSWEMQIARTLERTVVALGDGIG